MPRLKRKHSLVWLAWMSAIAGDLPAFRAHTIASGLKSGYQIVPADLNNDGKLDLIAVDERGMELAWYENPTWERHILLAPAERVINLDFWNSPAGPLIVLGQHFETNPDKSIGNLILLTPGPDVRQPWNAREIDRVPTAHRIRWIDPRGDGNKILLVAPLVGPHAHPPDYNDHVPIYFYRPGEWKRQLLSAELSGILHGILPVNWNGKGAQSLLTANFEGIHLFEPGRSGAWRSQPIAKGDSRPCPQCGTSDVRVGSLGRRRFIAAIEPWHGNQVVVYIQRGKSWDRTVIEDGMTNGHGLAVGDLDGDGRDEIVAGFRGPGFKLYVFQAQDAAGRRWKRTILDDGVAGADCRIADFTGDGRLDIACSGASTGNVKLFENLGRSRGSVL